VVLIGAGPDGTFGTADDTTASVDTAGDGSYTFTGIAPGDYVIVFSPSGSFLLSPVDSGTDDTVDSDADPSSGETAVVAVASGAAVTDVDAGMYSTEPATIGDVVWSDLDGDGHQDATEPGVGGVVVTLYDSSDLTTPVAVTTTDADGAYSFTGLDTLPDYVVAVDLPVGAFAFTTPGAGGDPATDSDVDDFGMTAVVEVAAGASYLDEADAGILYPASIGDLVWVDADGDGIQDAGEPGASGITVNLFDAADPVTPLATTATDGDGLYLFAGLDPTLQYVVRFELPPDALAWSPAGAGSDGAADSDVTAAGETAPIAVSSGVVATAGADAGIAYPAEIGDLVWYDVDGDGVPDAGEPGIPGVRVSLLGADGAVVASAVTDAEGRFGFVGLPAGEYRIEVDETTLPNGLTVATHDPDGTLDSAYAGVVSGGGTLTAEFGYLGLGVIGDTVWYDIDGDGVQSIVAGALEPGIPGVELSVLWFGFDGISGTADDVAFGPAVADDMGHYLFSSMPYGMYAITVGDPPPPFAGAASTIMVTLDAAVHSSILTADFPFTQVQESLPRTGFPFKSALLWALASLAAGLLLIGAGRRRDDDHRVAK
jgi:hypothetical protein